MRAKDVKIGAVYALASYGNTVTKVRAVSQGGEGATVVEGADERVPLDNTWLGIPNRKLVNLCDLEPWTRSHSVRLDADVQTAIRVRELLGRLLDVSTNRDDIPAITGGYFTPAEMDHAALLDTIFNGEPNMVNMPLGLIEKLLDQAGGA
jgi:hypothetical protein